MTKPLIEDPFPLRFGNLEDAQEFMRTGDKSKSIQPMKVEKCGSVGFSTVSPEYQAAPYEIRLVPLPKDE